MDDTIANENDGDSTLSNAELRALIEIFRRNAGRELDEFDPADVRRWGDLKPKFNLFLWRASRHETNEAHIASEAVRRAADSFYARIGVNHALTGYRGYVTREIIWRLQTPRSWLLRAVRKAVKECRRTGVTMATAPPPPEGAMRPPHPAYVWLAVNGCQLKEHHRPRKLLDEGHCLRACDLLFMQDIKFSKREMGYVLNIPKSSAFDRLFDCEEQLKKYPFN